MRNICHAKKAAVGLALLSIPIIFAQIANGQVMSSSNYRIESDSLNFGGARSASGSYTIEDTLGEVSSGISSSTNYAMLAGYQQMQQVGLTVVPPSPVTLSPSIGGLTGGTSNGSTTFTVTTDDNAGYSVTIQASTSPALAFGAYSFADYAPSSANPDYTFVNAATSSSFAFSPKGSDTPARFLDNGSSACGTGSGNTTGACWDGLSTSAKTVASRASANHPSGTVTTLHFRAASGSSHVQIAGNYVATTTITITPL